MALPDSSFPLPPVPDLGLPIDKLNYEVHKQLTSLMNSDICRTILTHYVHGMYGQYLLNNASKIIGFDFFYYYIEEVK